MKVQIIQVPYDSAQRGKRMGSGPEYFLRHGLEQRFADDGHEVDSESVETRAAFPSEIKTSFELYRSLAGRVKNAHETDRFPVVLSGNCGSALGTIGGTSGEALGVIWFDAHGDFNTPETTESGFLDGMVLAAAAGLCWKKMTRSIQDFNRIEGSHILHVGSREFSVDERAALAASEGVMVEAAAIREYGVRQALGPVLDALRQRVERVYLHFDLDVLDPVHAPVNEFSEPNGLSTEQVEEAIDLIGERFRIVATAMASYDATLDEGDHNLHSGIRILRRTLRAAARER